MITSLRLAQVGQSMMAALLSAMDAASALGGSSGGTEDADFLRISQIATTYLGTFLGAFPTPGKDGSSSDAPSVPDPGIAGTSTNTRYFKFACTVLDPYASLSLWPFIAVLTMAGVISIIDDEAFLAHLADHARVKRAIYALADIVCRHLLVPAPPGMPLPTPSLRSATFTPAPVPQSSLIQLGIKGVLAAVPLQYPLIVFKDINTRLSSTAQPVTCLRAYLSLPWSQVPHALCLMRNAADLSQRAQLRMGLTLRSPVVFRSFLNPLNITDRCLGFSASNRRTETPSGALAMTGVIEQLFIKDDSVVILSLILDDRSLPWFITTPPDAVAGDPLMRFLYARTVLIVSDPLAIGGLSISL
ncbi:hypothetical protein HXX76_014174 [Chlamydomonas incerta]|uniref:Uncharacterized protein n=1 Tax=Chlamydomonas incerta TaxID=51695 RepID=A0A835SSC5_CHLIN|nr:hypothetical protein HXX76_014174 [Chlamydomonas incerta]|eukprot:KAG2425016.1 hypothetical protein HXX76_014174 [Chlamydomonas incerta]